MEVLEEGNLMDRVPILLQRDLQFYQTHQRILQEPLCSGVVGGKLDFPRYASFASIKIILWWEDEFFASYRKNSGLLHNQQELLESQSSNVMVKSSDPEKFVSLVTKSADLLLEHLHTLSQESLDHADLSVLTATIGAAALVRNSLSVYFQAASVKFVPPKGQEKGGALKISLKQYSQLTEALAERLLDLHCRLLLLYIVQDAEALHWEHSDPFSESERGSYTIQMWWMYMCGTRDDLWNSVPPKMAQRIFAGMLNETLNVLTIRYAHIITSHARAPLHLVDISNLLFCLAELLPFVCNSGEAYLGLQLTNQSVIIRDIHAKGRELFYCLLLRGAPLGVLSKVFRKGIEHLEMFSSRLGLPSAWLIFALPQLRNKVNSCQWVTEFADISGSIAIGLELKVLLAFPEADWSFLLKVLLMRDAHLSGIILHHLLKHLPTVDKFPNVCTNSLLRSAECWEKCKGFLCRGECLNLAQTTFETDVVGQSNYRIVLSLTYLLASVGKASNIKTCLIKSIEESNPTFWSECLDKRQVWNQKRPPWLEALVHLVYPILGCMVEMLLNAVKSGASIYQAMSLALSCGSDLWECLPEGLYKTAALLQDIIPVSTKPLCDSVLLHIIFAAFYTELIKTAERQENSTDGNERAAICLTLSEAICSIDEDDKHTDQIEQFLKQAADSILLETETSSERSGLFSGVSTVKIDELMTADTERFSRSPPGNYALELDVAINDYIAEVLSSDVLSSDMGKQALKIAYSYLKHNKDWLLKQLDFELIDSLFLQCRLQGQNILEQRTSMLKTMFFIGGKPFDQLLTGSLNIDYLNWLQNPLSLNPERTWMQLSRRCDFQDDCKLGIPEVAMVATIVKAMKKKVDPKYKCDGEN